MCGIVGAVAQREVSAILLEGLHRLEYRGYDSAGMALATADGSLAVVKSLGKVAELEQVQQDTPALGNTGIAHTRWATHGEPSTANAHPHLSHDRIALVHNGIIENHEQLRASLEADGYEFASATDTEVIVHLLHRRVMGGMTLLDAIASASGFTDWADKGKVRILRNGKTTSHDVRRITERPELDIVLRPDDRIIVPHR